MSDTDHETEQESENIAQLRAAYEAEKAKGERFEAMVTAGVDLTTPVGKLFSKGYDGELTAEKITEAATAVGAIKVVEKPAAEATGDKPAGEEKPDADLATGEANSTTERQDLANGAAAVGSTKPDPRQAALDAARDTHRQTGSREKALATQFESLVTAAAGGDSRVILDVWDH